MTIREAAAGDAPALAGLLTQLGYPHSTDEAAGRLGAWAGGERRRVLVAESGGRVAGFAAVAAVPHFERAGGWARICALAVDEGRRRDGIGRRLVAAAEEAARGWGCVTVEVSSSRRRDAAHPFYRSLGYADRCESSALYRRELTEPGSAAARS